MAVITKVLHVLGPILLGAAGLVVTFVIMMAAPPVPTAGLCGVLYFGLGFWLGRVQPKSLWYAPLLVNVLLWVTFISWDLQKNGEVHSEPGLSWSVETGAPLLPQILIAVLLGEREADLTRATLPGEEIADGGLPAARKDFRDRVIQVGVEEIGRLAAGLDVRLRTMLQGHQVVETPVNAEELDAE